MVDSSRPALNENTWGIHINSARFLDHSPQYPDWLNPYQQKEWQDRGIVVWDATRRVMAHLYASCALKILGLMRETDSWKTSGFIVGSPAYQIPIPNRSRKKQTNETVTEMPQEGWVLTNKIELSSDRAAKFFEFLTTQEEALKQIAGDEQRDAREALGRVYALLIGYGSKKRGMMEDEKREEPPKKRIIPTTIPQGEYFTIPQAAEICNVTGRQIKKWIGTRDLEAVDLPGLGKIIEAGKLNKFANKKVLGPKLQLT